MNRWVVGLVGQSPRCIMVVDDDQIACNVRQDEVYFIDSGLVSPPHRINATGDGLEAIAPTLDELKAQKWAEVKVRRMVLENGGCATALGPVDSDPASRDKINGAVLMAMLAREANPSFSIDWTMRDNSVVAHDAAAIIEMGVAVGQHVDLCHQWGAALKAAIMAAEDITELDAIDITPSA